MKKSLKRIIIISLIFASFGQVASDLYIPSLPSIVSDLYTSSELVQLTLTAFMLSYSIARLFYGPLSDAIGRKSPLLIGFFLTLIGSAICLFANSIFFLIIGRFIQGFGAAAGSVLTAAILRDLLDGKELAKFNSYLAFINILFIASPPLLGGYLEELWGWRSTFFALFAYTCLILFLVIFFFTETNKNKEPESIKFRKITKNIKNLLSNKLFICYTILVMLGYATGVAWITSGAIIIQSKLCYSPVTFGWLALSGGVSYSIGALLNTKLVMRYKSKTLILAGSLLILFSGLLLTSSYLINSINIFTVMIPVYIFYFGSSFIFPSSYAGAMIPFPDKAGLASALLSSMQMLGGVIGSAIVAFVPSANFTKLSFIILGCGLFSLLVANITAKSNRNLIS